MNLGGVATGSSAFGTDLQGPLTLKQGQFASWAPLETFTVVKGTTPGGIRVRGQELIQPLKSGLTTLLFGAANTLTAGSLNLNPLTFPRLTAYSTIYEQFYFHKSEIMFQSNQPTTAAGVNLLAIEYDPKDNLPTTPQDMMRNISSSMSNIYANNATEFDGRLSRLKRFNTQEDVSSDSAQVNQARMLYAFEGVVGVNTTQGYLVVRYDVEFFTPQ